MNKLHPMLVEVPPSLHRAVKIKAAEEGSSIRALIAEGMRLVIERRQDSTQVARQDREFTEAK